MLLKVAWLAILRLSQSQQTEQSNVEIYGRNGPKHTTKPQKSVQHGFNH